MAPCSLLTYDDTGHALKVTSNVVLRELPDAFENSDAVEGYIEPEFAVDRDTAPPPFKLRKPGLTTVENSSVLAADCDLDFDFESWDQLVAQSASTSITSQIDKESETSFAFAADDDFDFDFESWVKGSNIGLTGSGNIAFDAPPAYETLAGAGSHFTTNDAHGLDSVLQLDESPNSETQDVASSSTANASTVPPSSMNDQPSDVCPPVNFMVPSAAPQWQGTQESVATLLPAANVVPMGQQQSQQVPAPTPYDSLSDNSEHRRQDVFTLPTPAQDSLLQEQMEYQKETERLCEEWLAHQAKQTAQPVNGLATQHAIATQQISAFENTCQQTFEHILSTVESLRNPHQQSTTPSTVSSTGKRTGKPRGRPPKPDSELQQKRRRISKNLPVGDGYTQGTLPPQNQKKRKNSVRSSSSRMSSPLAPTPLKTTSPGPFSLSSVVEDVVVNTVFMPNANPEQEQVQNRVQYLPNPNARLGLDTPAEDYVKARTARSTKTRAQGAHAALQSNLQRGPSPVSQITQVAHGFVAPPQQPPASVNSGYGGPAPNVRAENTQFPYDNSSMGVSSGYSMPAANMMPHSAMQYSNGSEIMAYTHQMQPQQLAPPVTPLGTPSNLNNMDQTMQSAWSGPQMPVDPTHPQQARNTQLQQAPAPMDIAQAQAAVPRVKRAASGQLSARSEKRQRHDDRSFVGHGYTQPAMGYVSSTQQMMPSAVATPSFTQAPMSMQSETQSQAHQATMQPEDNTSVANGDSGPGASGDQWVEEHRVLTIENETLHRLIFANYERMRRARLEGRSDQPSFQRLIESTKELQAMMQDNFTRMSEL